MQKLIHTAAAKYLKAVMITKVYHFTDSEAIAPSFNFATYILDVFMYYRNHSPVSLVDEHASFVHCHTYTGISCPLTRKQIDQWEINKSPCRSPTQLM